MCCADIRMRKGKIKFRESRRFEKSRWKKLGAYSKTCFRNNKGKSN